MRLSLEGSAGSESRNGGTSQDEVEGGLSNDLVLFDVQRHLCPGGSHT